MNLRLRTGNCGDVLQIGCCILQTDTVTLGGESHETYRGQNTRSNEGGFCCLMLTKADELSNMVRITLGPVAEEILKDL